MDTHRLHQLKSELQGNILTPYPGSHCARALLVRFVPGQDPARRREWLRPLLGVVQFGIHDHVGEQFVNLAFSHAGLRELGVDQTELSAFPTVFVEGMERRSRLLGDRPFDAASKWARGANGPASAVHVLILIHTKPSPELTQELQALGTATRVECQRGRGDQAAPDTACADGKRAAALDRVKQELDRAVSRALGSAAESLVDPRVDVVSQDLHAPLDEAGLPIEYFGFRDGIGQPQILTAAGASGPEYDLLGRFVIQHGAPLQVNGSFLVVRQLEQDTVGFWQQMRAQCPEQLSPKELAEAVMGRRMDGRRLDGSQGEAAFDKHLSNTEAQCPFHSHVRRVNPQLESQPDKNPRLIRRGISYADAQSRGLFFMAYNADLEQQFEFMQRNWIQRGNHVGLLSKHSDPIAGLPNGSQSNGAPSPNFRAKLSERDVTLELSSAVRHVGGGYFFVPGKTALHRIAGTSADASRAVEQPVAAALAARQTDRERLVLIQTWIDNLQTGGSFWRHVAASATGTLKVGDVLFVAEPALVQEMLLDAKGEFSVEEYGRRMRATFGSFMLGMDKPAHDLEYRANRVIPSANLYGPYHQPPQPARLQAVQATARAAADAVVRAQELRAEASGEPPVINLRQLIAAVLGQVTERYFGMSELSAGSMLIWSGYIARRHFRFASDTIDDMHARAAGAQLMSHVLGLIAAAREQQRDGSILDTPADHPARILLGLLDTVQAGLERPAGDDVSRSLSGARANDHDLARNLIGITLGSLAATAKAMLEGFAIFAHAAIAEGSMLGWPDKPKPAPDSDPTAADSAFAQIIQAPLHAAHRGSLDSVYRRYCGQAAWRRGEIEIAPHDTVVVWLGGARRTDALDPLFGAGIHKCPGMDMSKAIMNGVLQSLLQLDVWPGFDADDELVFKFVRSRDTRGQRTTAVGEKAHAVGIEYGDGALH